MAWRARVVDLLTRMSHAMRAAGDEGRAGAYQRAAANVARREDFDDLLEKGRIREIAGVGRSIERSIHEFVRTGEVPPWAEGATAPPAGRGGNRVRPGLAYAAPGDVEVHAAWWQAPFPGLPDLHVHTTWSDGTLTLDEVVAFARTLGARAVGVSDHSGSLRIARGLSPDEVRAQWEDVARVQAAHPDVRILRGTECDILRDGTLDHPREILRGFDYVIGSLHSHLRLPKEDQTARVLSALEDPHLTVLGHPTTRVPRRRPPAELDLPAVFAKAAERGVALEVNGNPGRLDLNAALARKALKAGCRLALGSDGHSATEMLALAVARDTAARAGATEADLVNSAVLERAGVRGGAGAPAAGRDARA